MQDSSLSSGSAAQTWAQDLIAVVLAALGLGALSTFGDWLWTHYIPDGAIIPGVTHGVIVFLAFAMVLARHAGTAEAWKVLLPSLPFAGLLIAAAFYPIARAVGYLAGLMITWVAMWLVLAALQRRARGNTESLRFTVARGAAAAVGSGLAFWAVSGMWTQPAPEGPNYAIHFVYWSFAFLPGFAALMLRLADPRP